MHDHDIQHLGGIQFSRYALRFSPFIDDENFITNLKALFKEFECPSDRFDWFIGLSYLILKGNVDTTRNFLTTLEKFPDFSSRIWSLFSESAFNTLYTQCHILGGILEEKESRITAFTLSGITPSQFSYLWFRECFFNVLNFDDISIYLSGCLLFGPNFAVYTAAECISLLLKQESVYPSIRSVGNFNFRESDSWNRVMNQL